MIEGVIKDNGRDNPISNNLKTGPKPTREMTIDSKTVCDGVF